MQLDQVQVKDNFSDFLNKINKSNSNISINSVCNLFYTFANIIKENIENINEKETSWDNPFITLKYPITLEENGTEIIFLKKYNENRFIENAIEKNFIDIFKIITKGIYIVKEKNKLTRNIPDNILEDIKKLPKEDQFSFIENYLLLEPIVIKPLLNKPSLIINFYPLVIDKISDEKYFSVLVNLNTNGFQPNKWKEKSEDKFWKDIFNYILQNPDKLKIKNSFENEYMSLPEPNIKTVDKKNKLIKTSLHTELQKFGKKPKQNQSSIFDLLDPIDDETKKDIIKYQIDVIGIDNTHSQNQALFAIQKLLNETDYKGNKEGQKLSSDENTFKFGGFLPSVKFTPTEYLDAYGVNKRQTSRGKSEYNSNERSDALKALRELSQKRYLFFYERKYWKDGKELYDIIKTVRPILNVTEGYESLNPEERDALKIKDQLIDDKLKFIVIEPSPALVDQINSYFVLKPANCYQEIRLLVGKTSKYVPLFIDYLRAEVTKREIASKGNKDIDWVLEINYETLAYKLRMDKLIKDHQTKKIKQELEVRIFTYI